jgi:hypothetical protein
MRKLKIKERGSSDAWWLAAELTDENGELEVWLEIHGECRGGGRDGGRVMALSMQPGDFVPYTDRRAIGQALKDLRINEGLTLRKFCEKWALDPGTVSAIERGLPEDWVLDARRKAKEPSE